MNINLLRTPEGLNQYLNEVVKTLPIKLPDIMLQKFLWQKVKNDFLITDEKVENLFEDNSKNLLVIKANEVDTKLMIGYLHIQEDLPFSSTIISNKAKELISELSNLAIKNKWNNNQIFIISTFCLSSYDEIKLEQFSNKAKYLSLTSSPNQKDKFYEIALDKKTNEFMEGGFFLNRILSYENNIKQNQNEYINKCPKCRGFMSNEDDCCQICGYPWSE